MTDSKKTNGDATPGDRPKKGARKHRSDDEVKIVEPGQIDDDASFLEEVAIQIDSLQEEDGVEFWKEIPTGAVEETPAGAAPSPTQAPADESASEPESRHPDAAIDSGRSRKTAGSSAAGRPSEATSDFGAAAARRRRLAGAPGTRRKKKGMRVGVLLIFAGLLLAMGAAGGVYLFKPEPRPEPRPPVRFSVPILPAPEQGAPADAAAEETLAAARTPAAAAPEDRAGNFPAAASASSPSSPPAAGAPETAIVDFLLSWQLAWENSAGENGRIDPYIAHYSRRFEADGMDLAAWRADKSAKNRQKAWIRVGIEDLEIAKAAADGTVTVGFIQTYESSNYADKTEKRLVLVREEGNWKILGRAPAAEGR